jgi:hypothetical protein
VPRSFPLRLRHLLSTVRLPQKSKGAHDDQTLARSKSGPRTQTSSKLPSKNPPRSSRLVLINQSTQPITCLCSRPQSPRLPRRRRFAKSHHQTQRSNPLPSNSRLALGHLRIHRLLPFAPLELQALRVLLDRAQISNHEGKLFIPTTANNKAHAIINKQTRTRSKKATPDVMVPPNSNTAPPQTITQPNLTFPFEQLPISIRQNIYSHLGFQIENMVFLFTDKHEKTDTAIRMRQRYNVDFNRSGQLSQPWNVSSPSLRIDLTTCLG